MTTDNIRKNFPLLQQMDTIYLDNAATAQRPSCVLAAVQEFYEQKNANPLRGFYPLSLEATESYQEARKTVQKFIHAEEPEEIIFTRNTTESLNLVAYSYGLNFLKEGDEIAVTIMEHHSNLLPWQMVSRMTGAKLHYLECTSEGELTDEALQKGINERTHLVAVAQVSNVLGCVNSIQKITEMAHRVGAVVVVDGAQSVPHMPVDVQALDVDFLAFSGHKLMGPMGIGCLYGKRELLERMPPFLTGGEMIDSVHRDGAVFAPVPQKFIHAEEPEEIIFTRNTTESLNLVAYSYGLNFLKEGDEIAVTIMEHHSNLLPWQMVSRMTGAKLHYLECTSEGELTDEALQKGINERTHLVAVAQVSNVLGCVNSIQKITEMAHRVGAVVVVDGAQSVPHMPVDVQALDVDFLAFSGHKLMGPMGIGCLYGKRELLERMPPFLTGGEMIDSVHRDGAVFAPVPQKFEAGTVNAAGAVGLAAAIRYLQEKGFDYIQKKELELTQRDMEGLGALPYVHILGSKDPANHTGIVSFTIDGVHPHDVSEILSSDGIDVRAGHHCAQPLLEYLGVRSSTRASMMFYNTPEEIDALIESVSTIRRRMGYGE